MKSQKVVKSMKLNLLKGKIVEKGMNVESLAEKIGIDRSSMYRKLNNFEKITIGEAQKIKVVLNLSDEDAKTIFFG
jgi:predicted transcriptional regulator